MLMSDVDLKSYTDTVYHNEELKSLTRYRFDKVRERAKLKQSVSRLVTILFPELEKLVSSLHSASVYALLSEFPGAKQISSTHILTHLKAVLKNASQGRYGQEMAETIRNAARSSVGSVMPAKSLELQHTIRLIRELDAEIEDIETAIQAIVDEMQSPITLRSRHGCPYGSVIILAEIGDFSRFDSPDKILAYAGMSPSTYQSGQAFTVWTPTRTWKNEVPVTCATLFTMPQNTSVIGTRPLPLTLPRNGPRGSTTTLRSLMRQRNWYV